jgi:hypothetical protein
VTVPPRLAGPPPLDRRVREVVTALLDAVDAATPGLIEGFYPVGSVALADFRPHESDIDFVAVTAARPDAAVCDALRKVHGALQASQRRPFFEGVYVTWDNLRRDPALAAPVPSWHAGRFATDAFALNPITWHTLAHHGIAVRGPAPADLAIHTDPALLAAWTLHNLDSYWRPWHDRSARLLSRAGMAALGAWAPAWGVLGVTRLHYTLATGEITSKAGAGEYAFATFPARWQRIINECLRIRRGEPAPSLYRSPLARRRDALAYIALAISSANELATDVATVRRHPLGPGSKSA